jgi:hypothetical protein
MWHLSGPAARLNERLDFARVNCVANCRLLASGAIVLHSFFDCLAGFAGAFLDAANEFVFLAVGVQEIVVGKRSPFLFQFTFGDVPVAFDFKCGHDTFFICLCGFAVNVMAKMFPQLADIQMLIHGGRIFLWGVTLI